MKHFSSSPYSSGRMVHKRLIPIITIDDDDVENEDFSSSPFIKRDKIETTTETFKDETSTTSAESLKKELHALNGTEVSNATNLTSDAEVQHPNNLVQDVMKKNALADDETSGEHDVALNGSETYINNNSENIIKIPNFEFQTTSTGNKRLIVFYSNDKTLCYKFYKSHAYYNCAKCWELHHKTVAAKLLKGDNGEEYVHMVHHHICKPFKYVPQSPNFQIQRKEIIIAPNYEIQLDQDGTQNLVVFVPTNPNLCYYYRNVKNNFVCCECKKSYKKSTSAKLLKDKDGKEYVQANVPHLCKPVPYTAIKWHNVRAPNFFVPQPNQKLIVFNSDHRNFCYHYDYSKWIDGYNCTSCFNSHHKRISAKFIKEVNGDECLQAINHLCDPFTYKISDAFDILKSPNFKFVNEETNGSAASILVLYSTIARSTCYTFIQLGSSYACSGCHSKGRELIAKIFKDENDEEVVLVWKDQQHICVPIICY